MVNVFKKKIKRKKNIQTAFLINKCVEKVPVSSLSPSEPPVSLWCIRALVPHTGSTPARPHPSDQLYSVQWLLDSGPENRQIFDVTG